MSPGFEPSVQPYTTPHVGLSITEGYIKVNQLSNMI